MPLENPDGAGVTLQVDHVSGIELDYEFVFNGNHQLQVGHRIPLRRGVAFNG